MCNKSFCSIAEIKHNIVNQLSLNKIKKKKIWGKHLKCLLEEF